MSDRVTKVLRYKRRYIESFFFFLSSKFLIGIFLKLQLPPESNKKFPADFYFLLNFCSRQKVYYKMEMAGHFFAKGGFLPNSSESKLKIFGSEHARWIPSQHACRMQNLYKVPVGGMWGILNK
jgi:hypothetical protein